MPGCSVGWDFTFFYKKKTLGPHQQPPCNCAKTWDWPFVLSLTSQFPLVPLRPVPFGEFLTALEWGERAFAILPFILEVVFSYPPNGNQLFCSLKDFIEGMFHDAFMTSLLCLYLLSWSPVPDSLAIPSSVSVLDPFCPRSLLSSLSGTFLSSTFLLSS